MPVTLNRGCYLGQVLSRRATPGIVLTLTRHPRSDWLPVHSHHNAYFCWVLSGQFSERFGQEQRLCQPRMLLFHPPQEMHSERIETHASSSLNVEIESSWWNQVLPQQPLPRDPGELKQPGLKLLLRRLQVEFLQTDSASPLAVEGLTLQLLAEVARCQRQPLRRPAWLTRIIALLHESYMEKLDYALLAAEANVHPVYLAQAFRQYEGCTPAEYQRRLRLDWAAEQLTNDSTTLTEIALQAGFADQSHFHRVFKSRTGLTPLQYRQQAAQRTTPLR
jgi:AraC family transcriptional regulator